MSNGASRRFFFKLSALLTVPASMTAVCPMSGTGGCAARSTAGSCSASELDVVGVTYVSKG